MSDSEERLVSVENVAIFKGLSADRLARVARRCDWRRYEPGEQIVHYQDNSNDVFFLVLGDARVTIYSLEGRIVSFRELIAGDTFGEYPAFDGGPRSASVEARSACQVASMPAAAFLEVLESEPQVAQRLIRTLVKTIRGLTNRVYEFSTLAVSNRIQAELLRLAKAVAVSNDGACISPAPTHAEIASRVSTHREAVTRELNHLSKTGIVERRANSLLIKDIDRLATMVHDAVGE